MVKLIDNNGEYRITIPKDFALLHKKKKGTELVFFQDLEGNVRVKEVKK